MTDIDKRIDEIMEICRKNKLHHACNPEDVLSITELRNGVDNAAEIIKHLQAQLVERDSVIEICNEVLHKCSGKARYMLKHQNFPQELSEYQKGFTIACELISDVLTEHEEIALKVIRNYHNKAAITKPTEE